jgi:hypothetical protein
MQRFRTLPLMPVEGGRLAAPAARPVIALGAWAPGVGSALTLLGCRLLDATRLPEVVMQVTTGRSAQNHIYALGFLLQLSRAAAFPHASFTSTLGM